MPAPAALRQSGLPAVQLGGEPMPAGVRAPIERSLGADMGGVRVHSGGAAQRAAQALSARAFAYGPNIVLGPGERAGDLAVIAHEAAHVVQQRGAPAIQRLAAGQSDPLEHEAHAAAEAVVRGETFAVQGHTSGARVQRLGLSDALNFFAKQANNIPGFRMFTIILGLNPINMSRVDRSAANIMRAIVEFIPGGGLITQALDTYGVFDKVGAWVEQQIATLGMTGSMIKDAITKFLDSLSWSDIFDLGGVWERAKRIFTEPIDRIINFAKGLITGILTFIKDAILMPLAKLAEGTRGWDLLIAVLGKNPITGEAVPRNADTLIGGFMKLIGQEEVWNNLKKANAVARAWAWFQGAMSALMGFVQQIPTLAVNTFKSLELVDIVVLPRAFAKVAAVFGDFIGSFISWAGNAVWNLLEIVFEALIPKAMQYLKKAAAAFRTILKDPIAFVGNLVRAGKLGFEMFASNIVKHLTNALIKWITGPLGDIGVYIPKSFDLLEIIKLVLSVLGLTWQNIRTKLVKIIPDPVLAGLEKTAGILVTLVKDGPAAAWEQIKTELSELKNQMISQIIAMVTTEVVKAAVVKVVSMLNPAGAFVQAIMAVYNTVSFFIEKINQIAAVVASFIDSISAIASGQVEGAAKKVEQTMANMLTVIIAFLAKFAGLGGIPDKLVGVIKKIRQPIDKGLDKIVAWLGKMLEKAKNALMGKKDGKPDPEKQKKIDAAIKQLRSEEGKRAKGGKLSFADAKQAASLMKSKNRVFQSFDAFESGTHIKYRYTASPTMVIEGPEELPEYYVNESDIDAPEAVPGKTSWEMTIFANITDTTGKRRVSWVMIAIPMDPELDIPTKPPAPSMIIEGRVSIDGKMQRLKLNGGAITEYALKLIISRYTARFGDLSEIHGSLGSDNKSLYQIAYAKLRKQNVDEDDAKMQAILKTPFGKYRAKLKYDKFEITLKNFSWAIIPQLDPERKERFYVPTSIDVIARR